jgi:uncharacterized repeat protein (TIGR01451 family)
MMHIRSPFWLFVPVAAGLLAALVWLVCPPYLQVRAEISPAAPLAIPVFINEIHYDNDSIDTGEAIEIAGPAGTDLSGWSLVLYTSNTGLAYDTDILSGVIPNHQNGFGTVFIAYPRNGLQNGSTGIALVDSGNNVVQFISYEGAFMAVDGPAAGLVSTDINILEPETTPIGYSLQLVGSGQVYEDFTWSGPTAGSFGAVNAGQHFNADVDLALAKSGPPSAVPGAPLRYTLVITNTGLPAVSGLLLTDTLPVSLTFATQDSPYPFTSPAPGVLVWEVGQVVSGTQASIHFTATADGSLLPGSLVTNTLVMTANAPGDDPGNNFAEWVTSIRAPSAVPVIDKQAPVRVDPGSLFTYTLTVQNDFAYDLIGVVITDALPADVNFIHASGGGVLVSDEVRWEPGILPAYGSLQVSFAVTAAPAATYLYNTRYAVSAGNYPGLVYGPPLVTLVSPDVRIHHIQGRAHRSPLETRQVSDLAGIVTARRTNGFYLQDPQPDGDDATSEGVFVYLGQVPVVQAGDGVVVAGLVEEFYQGGVDMGGLPTTRINTNNAAVTLLANNQQLPDPLRIGSGGRIPPAQVIEDDTAGGSVETQGIFDPVTDGIDFYESLEGMRVSVQEAWVVAGTDKDGEIAVVGDAGIHAGIFSARGALVVQAGDFNPERILIDDGIVFAEPHVNTGVLFSGVITGVIDYTGNNFKLVNTSVLPVFSGGVISETAASALPDQLSVAAFNLENLDPSDPAEKFAALATQIVEHLGAPDILSVEEIQDNSGTINDGVVSADQTFAALIAAIQSAGGPLYDYRNIDPLNGRDGGDPGGNIRTAFLFRPDRVTFVDRPGGDATSAVGVVSGVDGAVLTLSPGRVDPTNPAFLVSRKPLAGEFLYNGRRLILIACHFNSKTGDSPLFGRIQPAPLSSEEKRIEQAAAVNNFVQQILAVQSTAAVIVLGDLNVFAFSAPLTALKGSQLQNLVETLPAQERYSYIFDGNAQVIDHILVSGYLFAQAAPLVDIVHVNAEFSAEARPTDHEPVLARLNLPPVEQPDSMIFLPFVRDDG